MLPELYRLIIQNLKDTDIKSIRTTCKLFMDICVNHEYSSLYYDNIYDEKFYPLQSSFIFRRCKKFILKYSYKLPSSLIYINNIVIEQTLLRQPFINNPVYANIKKLHLKSDHVNVNNLLPSLSKLEKLVIDNIKAPITFLPKTLQHLKLPSNYGYDLCSLPDSLMSLKFDRKWIFFMYPPGKRTLPRLPEVLHTLHIGDAFCLNNSEQLPISLRYLCVHQCNYFSGSFDKLHNLEVLELHDLLTEITYLPQNLKTLKISGYQHRLGVLPESIRELRLNYVDHFDYRLIPQGLLLLEIQMRLPIVLPVLPPGLHTFILKSNLMGDLPKLPLTLRTLKLHGSIEGSLTDLPELLEVLLLGYWYRRPLPKYPPIGLKELRITHDCVHNYIIPLTYKNVQRIYAEHCLYCHKIHPYIADKIIFSSQTYSDTISEHL